MIARSRPYVPLEDFLEMEPEAGTWLEWCAGLVYATSVVVEVLSPSTEARDRGAKFEANKRIGSLEEYVLVSQDERRIEILRREERGWSCDVVGAGESFAIHGRTLAVDAIYG